jgi:hypothetical protein
LYIQAQVASTLRQSSDDEAIESQRIVVNRFQYQLAQHRERSRLSPPSKALHATGEFTPVGGSGANGTNIAVRYDHNPAGLEI